VTTLSLETRRNRIFLTVHARSFFSVISPLNYRCDHRLGLAQKLCKTSTIIQSILRWNKLGFWDRQAGRIGDRLAQHHTVSPTHPVRDDESLLPPHTYSNGRDRALTLTETGGLISSQHPKVTTEITTERGLHPNTKRVQKIARPETSAVQRLSAVVQQGRESVVS